MESIEQLQQDNAKLQERLNNAAKFFREQKAQIESLTNEKEELQSNIQSKDKAYEVLQNTYNEVFAENEERKKQVAELMGSQAANVETIKNEYELKLQKLEGDYKDLKKVYEDEQSEYENKITLLEEDNIKLSKDNDDYKKYIETLKEDANKLKENNDNFEKEYKSLEIINDDLNKQIDRLEAKVSELLASDKEYREKLNNFIKENTALNTALGEAEEDYNKLMLRCEKYDKFISVIIATAEEFNYINTQHNDQKATVNKNNQNNTDNVFIKNAPEINIPKVHNSPKPEKLVNSTGNQFMSDEPALRI